MSHDGSNDGFYVLDDIVCEAVSVSGLVPSKCHPGINEGMPVAKELLWQVPNFPTPPLDSTNQVD
ncbi:hypothetical protein BH10PLA2_BH10PLA2_25680 [soil metagenome]